MSASNKSRLLSYINDTATASSEDDVNKLLKLMSPSENRSRMGAIYEDALGYNPITHFDKEEIRGLVEAYIIDAPDKVTSIINTRTDDIIEETYSRYDNDRNIRLAEILHDVIKDLTGWAPDGTWVHTATYDYSEIDGFEAAESEESVDDDEFEDESDDSEYGDSEYYDSSDN